MDFFVIDFLKTLDRLTLQRLGAKGKNNEASGDFTHRSGPSVWPNVSIFIDSNVVNECSCAADNLLKMPI